MSTTSEHLDGVDLTVLDNGQLVVVASWARMLAEVKGCLDEAGDEAGLGDLGQLRGLCDRADAEAMLPIVPSEIGSDVARRLWDLHDIIDGVVDELVRRERVTLRGLKSVGGKAYYGRYVRSLDSGHVAQLGVLTWSWTWRYPSPFWLRVWRPDARLVDAWSEL